MAFNVRILDSSSTVNNLISVKEVLVPHGEPFTLFFQLINQSSSAACPLRYIPPVAGSAVSIQINGNSANTQTIIKATALAFNGDTSVYRVDLTALEAANIGSVNLQVFLNDGMGAITSGWAYNSIIPGTKSPYWC